MESLGFAGVHYHVADAAHAAIRPQLALLCVPELSQHLLLVRLRVVVAAFRNVVRDFGHRLRLI